MKIIDAAEAMATLERMAAAVKGYEGNNWCQIGFFSEKWADRILALPWLPLLGPGYPGDKD